MSILRRPLYRVGQLLGALRPQVDEGELEAVRSLLGARLMGLFSAMSVRDQRHCLDVHYSLRRSGCEDDNLLTAALLHDVGKTRAIRLWHRVAYVALQRVAPCLRRAASRSRGLDIMLRHAELGAKLAEAGGATKDVVDLIRRHEGRHSDDHRLRMLQAADDSC